MWKQLCEVDSGNWEKERPHGQSSSCHEFWRRKFEIEILNTGEIVYDMEKFAEIAGKYV